MRYAVMEHGGYVGSIVIQFIREVRLERMTFSKDETLVLNGKKDGRLSDAKHQLSINYCGSLIPEGSYKMIANYIS